MDPKDLMNPRQKKNTSKNTSQYFVIRLLKTNDKNVLALSREGKNIILQRQEFQQEQCESEDNKNALS